jgi:hypothetical protein
VNVVCLIGGYWSIAQQEDAIIRYDCMSLVAASFHISISGEGSSDIHVMKVRAKSQPLFTSSLDADAFVL